MIHKKVYRYIDEYFILKTFSQYVANILRIHFSTNIVQCEKRLHNFYTQRSSTINRKTICDQQCYEKLLLRITR